MDFSEKIKEIESYVIDSRHYLHSHAELPYEEHETTAFLVSELEKMGIPVVTFADYTGCIAVIDGEKTELAPDGGVRQGKTLLLRADIDALPIEEKSGVEFASIHPGVMHACGHDCHAAMLLGAARLLWENRGEFSGRIKLLFQAAEEAFYGSHYYVDKGYLDDVDAAMGMHVWPAADQGQVVVRDGPLMASCDNFVLTVKGVSAHGSTPNEGKDAIVAASAIICALQTAVSREVNPVEPLVVTVGKIRSGTQFNIVSDTAVMEGTVRTYRRENRDLAENAIRRIAERTAEAFGCTVELDYDRIEPPVCNNDLTLNAIAREAAKKIFGENGLANIPPATGSEDFSYIMEKIPSSVFVFFGIRDEENGCVCPVHNEKFKVNDRVLPAGAAYYAQFAVSYLNSAKEGER